MKQKTVKSAIKRVTVSGSGKLLRGNLSAQHLAVGKSKRTRQKSNKKTVISKPDTKRIKRLIPKSK